MFGKPKFQLSDCYTLGVFGAPVQIAKYGQISDIWLFGYLARCTEYGRVGYPWKEQVTASSGYRAGIRVWMLFIVSAVSLDKDFC